MKTIKNVTINEAWDILVRFQKWRTGVDERTLNDTGLTPHLITVAIDAIIDEYCPPLKEEKNNADNIIIKRICKGNVND